ncbi:Universal stress protein E [invertebrate metagenome]|uniref:Universal stress protein E n=1 Tax=invertebrate metagenome TaxID=1711999 RepID=A0A2H9TBA7_9ZZZZ
MHAFRSILLAITRLHSSGMELQQAFKLAQDNNASLTVALFDNSIDFIQKIPFAPLQKKLTDTFHEQIHEELDRIQTLAWDNGLNLATAVIPGRPRETIFALIEKSRCDLVIKLADPSGALARHQLTGNDLGLLRKCPVPVLMMADKDQLPDFTGNILVAMDVSDPDIDVQKLNIRLLQYGLYLASQEQAKLHIISVWDMPSTHHSLRILSDEELYELQETTQKRYQSIQQGIASAVGCSLDDESTIHSYISRGQPAHEIQKMANRLNADIIVMGTLGRHNNKILMGNTAENIINGVYCSILAIKPEDYVCPL